MARVDATTLRMVRETFASGDRAAAVSLWRASAKAAPEDPHLPILAGEMALDQGRPRQAAEWLRRAAWQASRLGHAAWASHLLVRACKVHPSAVEAATAYARSLVSAGAPEVAVELLLEVAPVAVRGGIGPSWSWVSAAAPIARSVGSRPLAVSTLAAMAFHVGVERVFFHLVGGGEAPGELPGGYGLMVSRFLSAAPGDPRLAALRADLAWAVRDALRPDPPANPRPASAGTARAEAGLRRFPAANPVRSTSRPTAPCDRLHRPRPWQIPASIEALRTSPHAAFPREDLGRLPAPLRRAILWLEADRRRAARAQAAAASAGAR